MQAPPGPRRTSFVLKVQPPWSDALNSQPHRELLPWFAAQVSVCGGDCECRLRRTSRRPGPDSPLTPLFPGCTEASSVLETEQRRAWHLSRAGTRPSRLPRPQCHGLCQELCAGLGGPASEASVTGHSFSFSDALDPREAQRAGHGAQNLSCHVEGTGTP